MKEICLIKLENNKCAVVKSILGGILAQKRLEILGIRPGKKITKISAHFWRGPVIVLADKTKIAIGHGLAQKIIVEI